MARNLLVTGGAGFIGSNFIHYWMEEFPEDKVVNYDKLTYAGNLESLEALKDNPNYSFVKGDITDYDLVEKTVKENKIDLIVHFAAETHVDRSIEGPAVFIETNVIGTQVLLDVAKNNGNIRFHHISTDEVYGHLPLLTEEQKAMPQEKLLSNRNLYFAENSQYDPRSPYSASKAGSDHLVNAYHHTYGLPVTVSNCSNNYGPFEHAEKLIPLVISRALNDQQIPVYGDGMQVRDWIHVRDHNRGVRLIIEKGKVGETYVLGGNGERHNIDMVKAILDLLDKPHDLITHVGDRKGHDRRYAVDFRKAKNELGFEPEKPLEEWLQETVKWYVDNKWWWEPHKTEADKIAEKYLANPLD
ncbi:dTDP-glucose 4,6-dehydratase [Candidatus Dojkabacteria bacterium]|nr:dTDP-glucose 4,6-dehydratase [Candidatus Dojkabacteria bacterium]